MTTQDFLDEPPQDEGLTHYDRTHVTLYMRLLDSAAEGVDWTEAVEILFSLNPKADPDRAKTVYDRHLARARWMTHTGYRHLLRQAMH